jgi:hypothetical protein
VKSQATALYLPRTGFKTLEDGNRRSGVQAITASSPNPPPESDDAEHEVARKQDHQPEHRSMAALVGFSPRTFRYAAHHLDYALARGWNALEELWAAIELGRT